MNEPESLIFESTAHYYARYRRPYPVTVTEKIAEVFGLDGTGRLFDLGCGTGQLAIPLASRFEDVVALDSASEMVALGSEQAEAKGIGNIRWMVGSSNDLSRLRPELGDFRLVTIGNAFHWMDRGATLAALDPMVLSEGGIAVLGGSSEGGVWEAEHGWKKVARTVIQRWLGERRRAGTASTYSDPTERHEAVMARSSFAVFEILNIPYEFAMDVEEIVGLLYSTSYVSPAVLGEKREGFESDLRASLLDLDASGRFANQINYELIVARRP